MKGIPLGVLCFFLAHNLHLQATTTAFFAETRCGVPQGDILSPLLFLVNINHIFTISDRANTAWNFLWLQFAFASNHNYIY